MFRKFIGFALICAIIFVAFFLLERCESVGGGKQPLALLQTGFLNNPAN